MKVVALYYVVRNQEEADTLLGELNDNLGIYCLGHTVRNLTKKEQREVEENVPEDIIKG
jgi:hypothetical protein